MQNLSLEHSTKFKKHKFDRFGDVSGKECVLSHWGPWTPCTTTCGPGQKKRFRVILEYGIYGVNCPHLDETALCNLGKCQINVLLSPNYLQILTLLVWILVTLLVTLLVVKLNGYICKNKLGY